MKRGRRVEQLEFFDIPNPCRGVCESDLRGYCKGCLRSRNERLLWLRMTATQKRYVLSLCRLRLRKMKQQQIQQAEPTVSMPWTQDHFDF